MPVEAGALSPRAVAKRRQITDAARRLFLSDGFAGTSMDAVTAEAGVSKQTLYRYFPTKVDLLADILYGGMRQLVLDPPEPAEANTLDDLRESLVEFAVRLTSVLLQPDTVALVRLVLGEAFRVPELRAAFRDALPGQVLARTEALLSHADARGILRIHDARLGARLFVGPVMTYVALDGFLSADPAPPPPRAELERIVDAFLASVAVDR